jgi:hypothetical protein
MDGLSPANHERAVVSMSLLDDVRRRSEELRAGLACTPVTSAGSDTLGPKLGGCVDGPSAPQHQQATGEEPNSPKADPRQSGPATNPSPSGKSPAPADQLNPAPGLSPATGDTLSDQTETPAEQDDSGDDGPLDGLLNNIFGG